MKNVLNIVNIEGLDVGDSGKPTFPSQVSSRRAFALSSRTLSSGLLFLLSLSGFLSDGLFLSGIGSPRAFSAQDFNLEGVDIYPPSKAGAKEMPAEVSFSYTSCGEHQFSLYNSTKGGKGNQVILVVDESSRQGGSYFLENCSNPRRRRVRLFYSLDKVADLSWAKNRGSQISFVGWDPYLPEGEKYSAPIDFILGQESTLDPLVTSIDHQDSPHGRSRNRSRDRRRSRERSDRGGLSLTAAVATSPSSSNGGGRRSRHQPDWWNKYRTPSLREDIVSGVAAYGYDEAPPVEFFGSEPLQSPPSRASGSGYNDKGIGGVN